MSRSAFCALPIVILAIFTAPAAAATEQECERRATNCLASCADLYSIEGGGASYSKCVVSCDNKRKYCMITSRPAAKG
jgi:hypothetical protein